MEMTITTNTNVFHEYCTCSVLFTNMKYLHRYLYKNNMKLKSLYFLRADVVAESEG